MIKVVISFILFAGIIYYFNVDIMALIDKSGAPEWLLEHGYRVKNEQTINSATSTALLFTNSEYS